jgi:hypothetical protein
MWRDESSKNSLVGPKTKFCMMSRRRLLRRDRAATRQEKHSHRVSAELSFVQQPWRQRAASGISSAGCRWTTATSATPRPPDASGRKPCVVPLGTTLQETAASPSAKCTRGRPQNTRASLPRVQHSGKSLRGCLSRERGLPRVPKIVHSGKPSPSVILPLGDDLTPSPSSPFFYSSPSATLGEEISFFYFETSSLSATLGEEIHFF